MRCRPVRSTRRRHGAALIAESLESRVLLSAAPIGLSPYAARHAYGFDQTSLSGIGQTIAIVTAYDAPTIAADLDVFDTTFNVDGGAAASTFFSKAGMASRVAADAGWAQETALDVEWAHAAAPGARILLVEAASDSMNDLTAAVNYARSAAGVSVVSMSWGGDEFSSEKTFDSYFTTPTGHQGVTFVASSGDSGGVINYPAVSPNVLAVGGTTLRTGAGGTYISETAWSDSGGGASRIETASAAQTALTGNSRRTSPDVSYDANPSTGFAVYDSYAYEGQKGWLTFGGTSAGTPQWAGLIAVADQGRAIAGLGSLNGATQTLPAIYAAPSADFHDISAGMTSRLIAATSGYDDATGRGSPVVGSLVSYLAGYTSAASSVRTAAITLTPAVSGTLRRAAEVATAGTDGGTAITQAPVAPELVVIAMRRTFTSLEMAPLPVSPATAPAAPLTLQESTRTLKPIQDQRDELDLSLLA